MPDVSTPDGVQVRPLTSQDHPVWLPLWRGYQAFYHADLPAVATEATWRRFHDPAEPIWGALAWRGEEAVGLVHWIFHRSTWTVGDYCYLQDLFVDPTTRGGGIGRRLISHVYAEAARTRCARVYWLTHETNAQAIALYDQVAERSGFVQYRRQVRTGQ